MRIGINALYLIPGGVGGTEIYLRSLVNALAETDRESEFLIWTNKETGDSLLPAGAPNFKVLASQVSASNRPARILWEQMALPLSAAAHKLDVLFNPGFTAPVFCPCPQVTVFHDLQHKRHPEYFRWFDLPFWRLLLYGAARRSRLLIADSEATKSDLRRFYGTPEEKIRVVGLGVDSAFFALRIQAASPPYLLAVSTLHRHKNLDRLLRAFARFHREHPQYSLIVAGLRGFHAEALETLRNNLGIAGAVQFTGWIPRGDLYELFARASAFIYPSTFEGFGIPVLEGMAAGLPVACSNVEPLASLAGDAALQFDPNDESAILDAIVRITRDDALRQRLSAAGPARAALHSWEECARLTLDALKAAAC